MPESTAQIALHSPTGDVLLREGSRLEWDQIAGIGVPGQGTCVGIGKPIVPGEAPPIAVWIDPNDELRAFAADVRASIGNWNRGLFAGKTGLDGEGGVLVVVGDVFDRAVRDGSLRILREFADEPTYKQAMDQWRADTLAATKM